LFEVKEHWGALGLAFLLVYYFLRRSFQPDEEREKLFFYIPLCLLHLRIQRVARFLTVVEVLVQRSC